METEVAEITPLPVQELRKTARYDLQLWLWDEIEGEAKIHLPTLTEKAIAHFTNEKGWLAKFATETLYSAVKSEVTMLLSQGRTGKSRFIEAGESLVDEEEISTQAKRLTLRWTSWFERVGDSHKRLLDMTKADLMVASSTRRAAARSEERLAILWDQLAERLEGDVTVGAMFTVEEIEALAGELD